ncbi:hypothetical protein N7466_006417 [Penicillium verhagenii]|uniref:uncharacterized protein n=1 Tax=Penicillium verhagenii TaxID=1562060 RepID=UPI0025457F97|nr:uncharacterized protein N7466_006417 [Penicillium verhagenii]KAJ5930924.1 hypothetical protein N7466_006417 [Penicillium verhagenii]
MKAPSNVRHTIPKTQKELFGKMDNAKDPLSPAVSRPTNSRRAPSQDGRNAMAINNCINSPESSRSTEINSTRSDS